MKILLTNDDGIFAPGIYALAKELEKKYEIVIVAPEEEHSGQSHAITLRDTMLVKEVNLEGIKSKAYSVSGTPADCVRTAMDQILDEKPDIVFSGCNLGYNAGMDVLYSGTVSAAVEATVFGIPAIALSSQWVDGETTFETASKIAVNLFEQVKEDLLSSDLKNMVLSINVPYGELDEILGLKIAKIGEPGYDYYHMEHRPDGIRSLKLKERSFPDKSEGTDRYFLEEGFATLTPIIYDFNNQELFEKVSIWLED